MVKLALIDLEVFIISYSSGTVLLVPYHCSLGILVIGHDHSCNYNAGAIILVML